MSAVNREPLTAPHRTRNDAVLALGVAVLASSFALTGGEGIRPDSLGWTLVLAGHVPLVWRRRRPVVALLGVVACMAPYYAFDYNPALPMPAIVLALYTVAATGAVHRTLLTGVAVLGSTVISNGITDQDEALDSLEISGWIIAVLVVGVAVRYYRLYVASIVERAERAERTREEEARRRVAEERLRMARDLHDLLAHSITLIGVQTSVAAHVLTADPERLDRKAVAQALDDIAGTCRTARGNCVRRWRCCGRRTRPRERAWIGERGPVPCPGPRTCGGRCPGSTDWPVSRRPAGGPGPRSNCPSARTASRPPWAPPRTGSCRRRSPTPSVTVAARTSPCGWVCGPRTAH